MPSPNCFRSRRRPLWARCLTRKKKGIAASLTEEESQEIELSPEVLEHCVGIYERSRGNGDGDADGERLGGRCDGTGVSPIYAATETEF